MTTARDARLAYALLKLQQKRIADALKVIQPSIDQDPGDKNAARIGHARIGVVATSDPTLKATVSDMGLLVKFVQEIRPDEITMVPVVGETYLKALLAEMDRTKTLRDWDGHDVPGVVFAASKAPYPYFTPEQDAEDLLGVVGLEDLPYIDGVDLAALLGIAREGGAG